MPKPKEIANGIEALTNPKRVIARREEEAEDGAPARGRPLMERAGDVRFGKPFSKEERDEQERKLREILARRRGG